MSTRADKGKALDRTDTAPPERRLLGAEHAAAYLSISPSLLRRLTWNGDLPMLRVNRRVLWDKADLDRWIDRQKESYRA